ncbi:MAG: hypothetical protein K8F30_02800 [Taibaiella sp.]|nr:hypothetical protein [Taibaiella sp.]
MPLKFSQLLLLCCSLLPVEIYAQGCCTAGSGSPIAGGTSQGVLQDRQFEVNLNFQNMSTRKFLDGDKPEKKFLDYYGSNYTYLRLSYGLTKALTLSLEGGYYINRTQIGLNRVDTLSSSGISDIVIFPRYTVYANNCETTRDEVTVGLGYKIPVGKYNDSAGFVEPYSGEQYYLTMPPAVQPTTGSNDVILYLFAFRGYPQKDFRVFMNGIYIRKGWNPQGIKYGDYASVSLFAGKTFFEKLGVTLQVKGEWIDQMKYNEDLYNFAYYNFDVLATGMKQVSIVPQLSYSYKSFTIYALSEFPLYQYVNKVQIASQYLHTVGLTYRFFAHSDKDVE